MINNNNTKLTFRCTSPITDKIEFSFSFFKNPWTSVSEIGSSGSNVLRVLSVSNFCDIFGSSMPLEPSRMCLKK